MGSFLVWRKDTKAIHCCMPDAKGTNYDLKGLVGTFDADYENVYAGKRIPETLTTRGAKLQIYVDQNDQKQDRPAMPIVVDTIQPVLSNGVATVSLTGVPVGAELSVNGVAIGVADSDSGEVDFDLQGNFSLKASLYPFLDWEVIIHVI